MMRIGIDYTSAVRQGAGIGRYTRELIGALAELDRENEYRLFSAGRAPESLDLPDNFRLVELPLTDRHLAIIWQRLRLPLPVELLTGRVDLFHSPDFVLPPVLWAKKLLTVHDLSFLRYPDCSSPPLLEYLMRTVPRSVERADLLLADSKSTRRDLIELLDVSDDSIFVVYPAVDARFDRRPRSERQDAVLRSYGIRRPYILGLGTLQPRKNFPLLIRAYSLLRERYGVGHQLVIGGGKGWLSEEIEETIVAYQLEEDVLLTGYVRDDDLPDLYSAADVFAFPSLYEGFGIPILEAMACGTPVVTCRNSSLVEAAGDAALLVPDDDVEALCHALWRLLSEDELRTELIEKGYRQADSFTWEQSADRLRSIYERMG